MDQTKTMKPGGCCAVDGLAGKVSRNASVGGSERSIAKRGDKARAAALELHPDHSSAIKKLNRVIGQLQGVQRMIEDRRYCPDILMQTRAAASALKAVELSMLERHIHHCVVHTMKSSDSTDADVKIRELVDLFTRF